jgi:hypothetical protein
MLILELAFLTSVFYLGIAVLLETGIVLWARHSGSIGYAKSKGLSPAKTRIGARLQTCRMMIKLIAPLGAEDSRYHSLRS